MNQVSLIPVPGVDIEHRPCPKCGENCNIAHKAPGSPHQKNWRWFCRPCTNATQRRNHKNPTQQATKKKYREGNAAYIAEGKKVWAAEDRKKDPEKYQAQAKKSHEALMADPVRHAKKLAKQRRRDTLNLIKLKEDPAEYEAFLESERVRTRLRYERNKDTLLIQSKESHYRTKYGITLDQLRDLWIEQDCQCVICSKELPDPTGHRIKHREGAFHLDHCHETGSIRGLLCNRCNMAIGLLSDDVSKLESAVRYLNAKPLGTTA